VNAKKSGSPSPTSLTDTMSHVIQDQNSATRVRRRRTAAIAQHIDLLAKMIGALTIRFEVDRRRYVAAPWRKTRKSAKDFRHQSRGHDGVGATCCLQWRPQSMQALYRCGQLAEVGV
jgi:hypothetical protein